MESKGDYKLALAPLGSWLLGNTQAGFTLLEWRIRSCAGDVQRGGADCQMCSVSCTIQQLSMEGGAAHLFNKPSDHGYKIIILV